MQLLIYNLFNQVTVLYITMQSSWMCVQYIRYKYVRVMEQFLLLLWVTWTMQMLYWNRHIWLVACHFSGFASDLSNLYNLNPINNAEWKKNAEWKAKNWVGIFLSDLNKIKYRYSGLAGWALLRFFHCVHWVAGNCDTSEHLSLNKTVQLNGMQFEILIKLLVS